MPRINDIQKRVLTAPSLTPAEKLADLERQIAALRSGEARQTLPIPRRRRRPAGTIQYLTDDELARLFAAIRAGGSPRDLALFELAYHRGQRASEVGLVELRHLRPDLRRLFVTRLKSGTSAEYLLTERETTALRAWLRKRGRDPGPLFPSREGGGRKGIARRRLDQLMKHYCDAACVDEEKRHFHCLRHSCATSLLEHEVGIEDVQDHLGHRSIANTQIYAKISSRRRTRTGERLQREW